MYQVSSISEGNIIYEHKVYLHNSDAIYHLTQRMWLNKNVLQFITLDNTRAQFKVVVLSIIIVPTRHTIMNGTVVQGKMDVQCLLG